MKAVIGRTPNSITTLVRDNHDESGKYIFHTRIEDDAHLERNKRIRLESLIAKRAKFSFHDGEPVLFAFSIPQESWGFFQRDYPDIARGIRSRDYQIREESARKLQILHPEWVITEGNW